MEWGRRGGSPTLNSSKGVTPWIGNKPSVWVRLLWSGWRPEEDVGIALEHSPVANLLLSPSLRSFFLSPPFPFYRESLSLISAEVSSFRDKNFNPNKWSNIFENHPVSGYLWCELSAGVKKKIVFWTEDPVLSPDPLLGWGLKTGTSFQRL